MPGQGDDLRRSPSIHAVAERAGVSPATVSNVLNGKGSVTPAYAERVRAAVEDLGYVADPHASRLRSGRHALAGVIVPDLSNPMFGAFVSTLEEVARRDGFELLVVSAADSPEREAERLAAVCAWRPAGLIVLPCDGALAARLPRGRRPPLVVADRIPDGDAFDLVAVDNSRAAGTVAAHLAARGCRRCLVAGTALDISNVRERWEGVVDGAGRMAARFLALGHDADESRRRLAVHLAAEPRPDALFALDSVTGLAAYEAAGGLGLALPEDLAFAVFDDAEWMRLVRPAVTAVRQPVAGMARAAWARLMRRIGGDGSPPGTERLHCAVALRGSTARRGGDGKAAA